MDEKRRKKTLGINEVFLLLESWTIPIQEIMTNVYSYLGARHFNKTLLITLLYTLTRKTSVSK